MFAVVFVSLPDFLFGCNSKDLVAPEISVIGVPYMDSKGDGQPQQGDTSIIFPHDWFHLLATHPILQDEFSEVYGTDKIEWFWNNQKADNPKMAGLADLLRADFKQKCIALTLHSDGAEFQDRDSLNTVSIGGQLYEGQVLDKHLMIASYPKSCCVPGPQGTWAVIWLWLLWSFRALLTGVHPCRDALGNMYDPDSPRGRLAGTSIMNGYFAVLWSVLGDMSEFQDGYGLAHQASTKPCHLCQCNQDNCKDFRPTAPWKNTQPTLPGSEHLIMGLITVWFFMIDMLHVFELGITAHAVGNLLFEIVYEQLPGPRLTAFNRLWTRILDLYEELNVPQDNRMTNLALKNFTNPQRPNKQFPLMSKLKAAESRGLVEVSEQLAREYNTGTAAHNHRQQVFENLAKLYSVFDKAGFFLSANEFAQASAAMEQFQLHYNWLAKKSFADELTKWNQVPKFHYAWHLVAASKFQNPKRTRCYGGEDFVGRISRLAHSVLGGTPAFRVAHNLFRKYVIAMHIRFSRELV